MRDNIVWTGAEDVDAFGDGGGGGGVVVDESRLCERFGFDI